MSNRNIATNIIRTKSSQTSNMHTFEELTVLDACNNEFILKKLAEDSIMFEYKPIQPLYSCSGEYSGGIPVFKDL
jgi:hypothetical protein